MDAMLSLSFSIQSNKNIYALLLGSGISRSAGIPTGWDIVIDLIRKIAIAQGENDIVDPEAWYIKKYEKEPSYSEILSKVAKTSAERQHILEKYFEPTDEEKEDGIKLPTKAHREIAKLIKKGYIKVVVTTNFDRLLEMALQDEGITPTVISNEDSAKGAIPIIHSDCTIIKLHGDYKDIRVKNTKDELESYEPEIDILLDRIFDEFGLIICGWSADWDIALRNALYRRKGRRYPVYWTDLRKLRGKAKDLFDFLSAEFISIENADDFYVNISERVQAIGDEDQVHPASIKTTIAMLKKFLPRPENRIKLYDLLNNEVKQAIAANHRLSEENSSPDENTFTNRLKKYEKNIHICASVYANGCYLDDFSYNYWYQKLGDMANSIQVSNGYIVWSEMTEYPSMVLYYIAGIACLVSNNYKNLYNITHKVKIKKNGHANSSAYESLHPSFVFESTFTTGSFFGKPNNKTPANSYMYDIVRQYFVDIILIDEDYQYAFDSFEYLNGLLYATDHNVTESENYWGPVGRFYWSRSLRFNNGETFYNKNILIDYENMIKCGFFDGDKSKCEQNLDKYNEFIRKLPRY